MTQWRKAAWWIAAGMAVLATAAGAVHLYFDSARLTPLAQEKLQALSAQEITLDSVALTWLPRPGFTVRGISLANAAWAHEKELLHIDSLTLHPDLLPLLGGRLALDSIALSGAKLNLETDAEGNKNWKQALLSSAGTADARAGKPGAAANSPLDLKALTHALLSDGRISWRTPGQPAASWQITSLTAQANPGWRSVTLETRVLRDGHQVKAGIELADASRLGMPGAGSTGSARLSWDQGELILNGMLPLALPEALQGQENPSATAAAPPQAGASAAPTEPIAPAFSVRMQARSPTELLAFLQIQSQPVAALTIAADIGFNGAWMHAANISATLGKQNLRGDLLLTRSGTRPQFRAMLFSERIDWAQLTADAGRPAPAPVPPDEVFYTHPLAWPALVALKSVDGSLALDIRTFRTRSGIDVTELKAGMQFRGDQLDVHSFRFNAFSGVAEGSLQLDGPKKAAHLDIRTKAISLGEWFSQKRGKNLFSGAPMDLSARVDASGASMKQLAATLTGPVTVRVGPARVLSAKAGNAEALLTGLFTIFPDKTTDHLDLVCINASLPFANGVARASPLAGARSKASKLLAQGEIDLGKQSLMLRGRLRPYTGLNLGVASITGDVRIDGRLRHPGMHLDPLGTPGALARVGAAIVTGGLSLVATAAWDAAIKGPDPCVSVFSKTAK